jgi:hypothetical protein
MNLDDEENYVLPKVVMRRLVLSRPGIKQLTEFIPKNKIYSEETKREYLGDRLVAVTKLPNRCLYVREYVDAYVKKHKRKRDIFKDIQLIEKSKSTVDILGINALGPLHTGMERISDFISREGIIRIILLDPSSTAFLAREHKEEFRNNIICGRLRSEYTVSISICKDIINRTDFKGSIEIKTHSQTPEMALVISDRDSSNGSLNCNIYPEEDNTRGLMGAHKLHVTKRRSRIQFNEYVDYFNKLWETGKYSDEINHFIQDYKDGKLTRS